MTIVTPLTGWLQRKLDRLSGAGDELEARRDIAELARVGLTSLPWLAACTLDSRPAIAAAARQAMELSFSELTPGDLPPLDERLRSYRLPKAWQTLTPSQLETAHRGGTASFPFRCLATAHPNGYVRAAAMRRVAADPRALPFLLIRVNDWVAKVRGVAIAAIEPLIEGISTESWVANMPLVLRLEGCHRDDHRAFVARVVARLSDSGAEAALAAGLRSPQRGVRRAAFDVGAVRRRPTHKFLRAALAVDDPIVRLHAARLACQRITGEALATLAEQLGRDAFAAVRMLALEIYRQQPAPAARAYLLSGLHDPSASMREACQFYLRRDFAVDCAEEYRREITTGGTSRHLATSLLGLAETGSAGDASLALKMSSHAATRVRVAALRALARLDAEAGSQLFVEALADPSPRVARIARDTLLASPVAVDGPAIRAVFQIAPQLHSRLCALDALARCAPWSYLGDLLVAASDSAPEIVNRGRLPLQRWLQRANRHAVPPSAAQLATVRSALDACVECLDTAFVAELRSLIEDRAAGVGA